MDSILEQHIRIIVRQVLSSMEVTEAIKCSPSGRIKPLIAANWKMNKTLREAEQFFDGLSLAPYDHCTVVCCPAFPLLHPLSGIMKQKGIALGAQNIHEESKGAYTGEVQGELLAELGTEYVIIGHSERRMAGESNESIAKKVKQVLAHSMIPIICVGETQMQREQGMTKEVIRIQVQSALEGTTASNCKFVIAYEPIWAIGTGKTAKPVDVQEIHSYIRQVLSDHKGQACANEVPILYGGSVNSNNIRELCALNDVDGALVGGASLEANSFEAILKELRLGEER